MKEIINQVRKMGFKKQGHSTIRNILQNPAYIGLLRLKAYKDHPEEMVEGKHRSLIDKVTWYDVQDKLKGVRQRVILNEDFPLRGVLQCHCNKMLTGAASRGKGGKYYDYYKCPVTSRHNNISAIKAHDQMRAIMGYISLTVA